MDSIEKAKKMSVSMKAATVACSIMMFLVLLFPIWKIELAAPQYPEGLVLKIRANGLEGNVDVINGLNHYIGMRHLHTEDFIEFKILPYIISGYALLGFVVLFLNRRKMFNAWFVLFLFIAVISMVDFYRWEYDYGHELNPDAPIQVPGMSYQPPLIGYKKLLNFGAFSIPDIGGWIFVGVGVILLLTWYMNRQKKSVISASPVSPMATAILVLLTLASCSRGPKELRYGSEACDFCKMTILDSKYASQLLNTKGKAFKFDDSHCLFAFMKNGGVWRNEIGGIYFSDYAGSGKWIQSDVAVFLKSDKLNGPMGGKIAVFASVESSKAAQAHAGGEIVSWQELNPVK